ncbi:MAG: Crp/Fnr family transcriptional regulator, partial [Fusobacterium mortiferum]
MWLEENEFDKIIEKCNYKILNYQKDEYVAFRGDEIKGIYINLQGTLVAEMLK